MTNGCFPSSFFYKDLGCILKLLDVFDIFGCFEDLQHLFKTHEHIFEVLGCFEVLTHFLKVWNAF